MSHNPPLHRIAREAAQKVRKSRAMRALRCNRSRNDALRPFRA
jgi:hypothetical protein